MDMAKHIATAGAAVPGTVLAFARRAIQVRKSCAEWFRRLPGGGMGKQRKDDGHWHFIAILEDVVALLNPWEKGQPTTAPDQKSESKAETENVTLDLQNQFALLKVDEFDDLPDVGEKESETLMYAPEGSGLDATYEVAMENDESEVIFMLYCLFKDLNNIRLFLQETWSEYREGKIDLITASVTTNTAIDLVRDMQDDLCSLHPDIGDYETATGVLFVYACFARGEDPSARQHRDDVVNMRMIDVAQFLYIPAHAILTSLSNAISPSDYPWYNGQFGHYNPRDNREKMSIRERITEDRLLLMVCMPDLVMMGRMERDDILKDEFTKEFGIFAATKRISLPLVFATQVFVDIHNILRERAASGLAVLRLAGSQMIESLKKRAEENPKVPLENWPAHNEQATVGFHQWIQGWIIEDLLHLPRKTLANNLKLKESLVPFALMRRHPWLCGMMQFKLQLYGQEIGMAMADAWGTITYTGHLYEACNYSNVLQGKLWGDMEYVMQIHGKERMFKGRVPTTPLESLKSISYMMGTSPQQFAMTERAVKKRQNRNRLQGTSQGPSGLSASSPVSLIFRKRVCDGEDTPFTIEAVDHLLQKSIKTDFPAKLRRNWTSTHVMTPLQLLATLRAGLYAERDMIRFDYIRMHTRCLSILRDLHKAVDPIFTKCFGSEYFENEAQLAWLPNWVFLLASESDLLRQRMKIRNDAYSSRIMAVSGDVLAPWLDREGDFECRSLRKFSR
ncbi:hypothetical protein DFJ77DRAFT_480405 [Powellomyces hirtus]|nr:hypothetical protein DFJ77DRAFT_480405 [Powellomyces hirtus]